MPNESPIKPGVAALYEGMRLSRAQKEAAKAVDARIQRAYGLSCQGVQINILDIPKVFSEGRKAIEAGADDAALQEAIKAFVAKIRKN